VVVVDYCFVAAYLVDEAMRWTCREAGGHACTCVCVSLYIDKYLINIYID
jgi:hypothetical protein